MIDRERLLADDHQAALHAEARIRRLAADAAGSHAKTGRSVMARARLGLGRWLVGTGQRLDADTDPCGSAEARPA